jgi:hypothetical protein
MPHQARLFGNGFTTIRRVGTSSGGVTLPNSKKSPASWLCISEAARFGDVTLIYSSHDSEHNNAVVLKEFLNQCLNPETTG